jgi:glycosyltransferase involved in cell wall biosynthesis
MISKPIKVLQVTHAFGMGGAETWLMELLRLWSKSGEVQMDFLLTGGERGIFDDEASKLGAKLFYCRYGRDRLPQFAREFRRILKEGNYDAIHDHQDYASGWHFMMAGRHLPPVRITHVHNPAYQIRNNYGVTLGRRITALIGKRLVGRYATHIAGTSRQVVGKYGFDEPPFHRIPRQALHCGFDPARFAGDPVAAKMSVCAEFGWPAKAKILLFAGRTDRCPDLGHPQNHKNSGFAVQLGIKCAKRDSLIHMVLCGAPSDATPILQARIAAAGYTGHIISVGIRHDIERLMLASDVLLFPSRGEGLGMVAVEAQAAGLPVLASMAVPKECVVVDGMVQFLEVSSDTSLWICAIEEILGKGKPNAERCNVKVSESAFAIRNSASRLEELYRSSEILRDTGNGENQ